MGDYLHRVTNAFLGSELLPAGTRTKLMRLLGFRMSKAACIWAGGNFRSKKVSIGSGVFINVGFFHDGYDELEIQDNVRIGQFVRVLTATHNIGPHEQRGPIDTIGLPVTIEKGCWIGTGVTILPGVTIAEGCVISANSQVATSTQPDGVYAGSPAKRIRTLEQGGVPIISGEVEAIS